MITVSRSLAPPPHTRLTSIGATSGSPANTMRPVYSFPSISPNRSCSSPPGCPSPGSVMRGVWSPTYEFFRRHGHRLLVAHDHPRGPRQQLVGMPFPVVGSHAGPIHVPGGSFPGHRVIEFPVLQHFRPQPAVDTAAQVLDELTVDVFGNRFASLIEIHVHREGIGTNRRRHADRQEQENCARHQGLSSSCGVCSSRLRVEDLAVVDPRDGARVQRRLLSIDGSGDVSIRRRGSRAIGPPGRVCCS